MAVQNTLAIIASTNEKAEEVLDKFSLKDFRILFLSENEQQFNCFNKKIQSFYPGIEVEQITCLKEGCWEADVIILSIEESETKQVAERIREVATQKLVVTFSDVENEQVHKINFQKLLQNSKVVNVLKKPVESQIIITGTDQESILYTTELLKKIKKHIDN